ncbi:Globin family protein [Acanthocheilonema viteae]|uniref:Globin domain-containing protein n=1 Tax=Acanthocheilonema viteae TaxID=6277 RepID=A0A498SVZ1_ACAVI|nr:unnamed protein product [Acanthocheilonema viteae]
MGSGSSVPVQSRNITGGGGGGGGDGGGDVVVENGEQQKVDPRLPYPNFRELFTLKNYWKTVRRNERDCAKMIFAKYLKQNPDNKEKYPKLKNIDVETVSATTVDSGFETVAANYLKVFDDVITTVEEKPADVSDACSRLTAVGKMHRTKVNGMDGSEFQLMEEPFLYMISEVLQDRYNDKAENLFRKLYQFCLKYILEGFNS